MSISLVRDKTANIYVISYVVCFTDADGVQKIYYSADVELEHDTSVDEVRGKNYEKLRTAYPSNAAINLTVVQLKEKEIRRFKFLWDLKEDTADVMD